MPNSDLLPIILDEIRAIRKETSDDRNRITALETELHPLLDNGQPGRLTKLEVKVSRIETYLARAAGSFCAISAVGTLLWAILKYCTVPLLIIGLGLCVPLPLGAQSKRIELSTVFDSGHCTATAVGRHTLLTASHCEAPTDVLTVNGETTHILHIIRDGKDHSLMIVDMTLLVTAKIIQRDLLQAEDVTLVGNPGELQALYRRGYFAGKRESSLLFVLPVYRGDSGAGIIDKRGNVVAVVSTMSWIGDSEGHGFQACVALPLSFTDLQLSAIK
jgi:hypothetical protein